MLNYARGSAIFGLLLTLSAGVLFIFFCIGNFTIHQVVPKNIRIIELTTFDLGTAISNAPSSINSPNLNLPIQSIYGPSSEEENVRIPGDGLRFYYTWGLWNRCAGYRDESHPQYCTKTLWAHRFEPIATLLEDVPLSVQDKTRNLLSIDDPIKSDHYVGQWSRAGFYFIMVSIFLTFLTILMFIFTSVDTPAGRLVYLNLVVLTGLGLLSNVIGSIIWTTIVGTLKAQLNARSQLGLKAYYGNGLWILWATDVALLISMLAYFIAFIRGRKVTNS